MKKSQIFIYLLFLFTFFSSSSNAVAENITFSLNQNGIQSLSYAGNEFVSSPITSSSLFIYGASFVLPNGSMRSYGYLPNALNDAINVVNSNRTNGSNYYTQTYLQGKNDTFTLRMDWILIDNNTLKVITNITNNDLLDNLTRINLVYTFPFITPSNLTVCTGCNTDDNIQIAGESANGVVATKLKGSNWSVTFYSDNYSTYWNLASLTNFNTVNTTRRNYIFSIKNYINPGGNSSNIKEDIILPNQTKGYTFYIRFGDENTSIVDSAQEGFQAFRNEFPYLVNWSDRRPIGRIFLSNEISNTLANPRGYLFDGLINVSNQTDFDIRILDMVNDTINIMNNMTPRPQGIVVWDLEGQEFNQYFSYVGYPNKLGNISPEMDAVVDEMFQNFKDEGYLVGMTLRPSDFQTGLTLELPSNCTSSTINWALANTHFIQLGIDNTSLINDLISNGYFDSNGTIQSSFGLLTNSSDLILDIAFEGQRQNIYNILQQEDRNHDTDDVFVATDGVFPYRGYVCRAPNTWSNRWPNDNLHNGTSAGRFPYYQHSPQDDLTILRNLESKINYSITRWDAKIFYIDSTVYSDNGGGGSFNFNIIRQLQIEFPEVLLLPENEGYYWYAASAPYNQVNAGTYFASTYARYIYPNAFTALANYDGVNFSNSTSYNNLVESVKNGNIFMVDPQSSDPATDEILEIYNIAEMPPQVNITSPINTTYNYNVINVTILLERYGSCEYSLDSLGTNNTLSTSDRITFTNTTLALSNGDYTLNAYCNDSLGLTNYTKNVSFRVNVIQEISSNNQNSGGGGGIIPSKSKNITNNIENNQSTSNNEYNSTENEVHLDDIELQNDKFDENKPKAKRIYLIFIIIAGFILAFVIISIKTIIYFNKN